MTITFFIFPRAIGIIVIGFKVENIGNMFPICISDGFYMCSEPFAMALSVRNACLLSTEVEFFTFPNNKAFK